MLQKIFLFTLLLVTIHSSGQVNELEQFRKALTTFVLYDNGKIDSIPRSDANTKRLQQRYQAAFIAFVNKNDSTKTDSLNRVNIEMKHKLHIGNNLYFFSVMHRDPYNRSLYNNADYHITFYPVYDYKLPDFVSFYIQPYTITGAQLVAYYCKLNGKGTYYIKDVASNRIVFRSDAFTRNAAIRSIARVDKNHVLIVEDMGDAGERALVVNTSGRDWTMINGFYGKAFLNSTEKYTETTAPQKHRYFRFAQTRTIISKYGSSFLKKYAIHFDEQTQTISYKRYHQKETEVKTISARWIKNLFIMDDYYMGQDIDDSEIPFPN